MRWIKITDDNGQIDTSKLPKDKCYVAFRYTNGGFDDENYGTIRLIANDNDVMFLAEMEATHILILTDPNEPQSEDGLVTAAKRVRSWLNEEHKEALTKEQCEELLHSALSAWEGGK